MSFIPSEDPTEHHSPYNLSPPLNLALSILMHILRFSRLTFRSPPLPSLQTKKPRCVIYNSAEEKINRWKIRRFSMGYRYLDFNGIVRQDLRRASYSKILRDATR
jgi:hypothetical protein